MIGFWLLLSLLTIVTTFGLGTTVNMIFKRWWLSMLIYGILALILVIQASFSLQVLEWVLLVIAGLGAGLSSLGTRALKKRGYPLFS